MLLPAFIKAQSDTIYKKDGKIIPCKITLDNGLYLFFDTKKGINESLEKEEMLYFIQNGVKISANVDLAKVDITGQVFVNGVNINALDISYCELVGFDFGLMKSRLMINIDYGQSFSFGQSMNVESKKGKLLIFNSMIDALNFMEKNGWQYINQYAISNSNNKVYHILLKRK
jgi:hypothetical protein